MSPLLSLILVVAIIVIILVGLWYFGIVTVAVANAPAKPSTAPAPDEIPEWKKTAPTEGVQSATTPATPTEALIGATSRKSNETSMGAEIRGLRSSLEANNGRFVLEFDRKTGKLELKDTVGGWITLWRNREESGTEGPYTCLFQQDGNLVVFPNNNYAKTWWSSGAVVHGFGPYTLRVRCGFSLDDGTVRGGYLEIQDARWRTMWQSAYSMGVSSTDGVFTEIRSLGKQYSMVAQEDGNLVIYGTGGSVWSSGTRADHAHPFLVMQGDGALCMYRTFADKDPEALWCQQPTKKGEGPFTMFISDARMLMVWDKNGTPVLVKPF